MGTNSNIEWTDHTFNPWWGCVKVSQGCKHCYADTLATRYGHDVWGPHARRRFFGDKHWNEPIKWNKQAEQAGQRKRVFCASMADVFEQLPQGHPDTERMNDARDRLWETIAATRMLDWLLLTKRPENIGNMIPWADGQAHNAWKADVSRWQNVWLGTSAENQEAADTRIPHLLRVPAMVRFVSAEPLIGPVNLRAGLGLTFDDVPVAAPELHWIIAGGESGHGARPMHPDWARDLRDQCQAAGVAYFFKQWGEWAPVYGVGDDPDGVHSVHALPDGTVTDTSWNGGAGPHLADSDPMWRLGKKKAGRLLGDRISRGYIDRDGGGYLTYNQGREWNEFPQSQAVQG